MCLRCCQQLALSAAASQSEVRAASPSEIFVSAARHFSLGLSILAEFCCHQITWKALDQGYGALGMSSDERQEDLGKVTPPVVGMAGSRVKIAKGVDKVAALMTMLSEVLRLQQQNGLQEAGLAW